MKKYTIDIFGGGIDELLKGLEQYQKRLERKAEELVVRLAQEGVTVAKIGFDTAEYDGARDDIQVTVDERGAMTKAVVALGDQALFIEFGTGITYPDDHPDKPDGILGRGEYGAGHGKQRTWGFYGDDPGTNGVFATKKDGTQEDPPVILTHGNPANMPMYKAVKFLEQDFKRIVKEVFADV